MTHKHHIQQAQVLIGAMTTVTVLVIALMLSYSPAPAIHTLTGINPPKIALADDPSWTQTDWSGGTGTDTDTQFSVSSDVTTVIAGQFNMTLGSERLSNTGFESDMSNWSMVTNRAWDFDGINENIFLVNSTSMPALYQSLGNYGNDFSFSTWVKTSAVANRNERWWHGERTIVEMRLQQGLNNRVPLYLGIQNNTLMVGRSIQDTTTYETIVTDSVINDNTWHHIAVTYSDDNVDVYVDAQNVLSHTWVVANGDASLGSGTANFTLGSRTGYTGITSIFWEGLIENALVFDTALSASDVEEIYNSGIPRDEAAESLSSDIIGYWRAEDSSNVAGGVSDQSGGGLNGTMTNMEPEDIVLDNPSGTITELETTITYNDSESSTKISSEYYDFDFTQSVNVGDTNEYIFTAYAYTDGGAVTDSDVELLVDGSTISTDYTDMGDGWYQLSGVASGSAATVAYGVQVKASKTVYLDDFSLKRYGATGTLTSAIYDATLPAQWGTVTWTASNASVSLKMRSDENDDMSTATDWAECDTISDGADITDSNCITDLHQYIQYQITLTASDTSIEPAFNDITLNYITDNIPPVISLGSVTPDPISDSTPAITGSLTDALGTIASVEYQVDATDGSWTACTADDGTFDTASEDFTCTTTELTDGAHTIYIRSTDSNANTNTEFSSDDFVVDTTGPVVSNLSAKSDNGIVTITWTTDENASTQVEYGTALTYGSTTTETNTDTRVTSHRVVLSNDQQLTCSTNYNFRVIVKDALLNTTTGANNTFLSTQCVAGGGGGGGEGGGDLDTTTTETVVETPISEESSIDDTTTETAGTTTTTTTTIITQEVVVEESGSSEGTSGGGGGRATRPSTPITLPDVVPDAVAEISRATSETVDLTVNVVDINNDPVIGAEVTLRSTPRTRFTNTLGQAIFRNVEAGDHTLTIEHNGQVGEQSISLLGDVRLTIQMELVATVTEALNRGPSNEISGPYSDAHSPVEPTVGERIIDFFRFCWLRQCEA